MASAKRMKQEAAKVASVIYSDLGLNKGRLDFARCWQLCQEHHSEPLVLDFPRRIGGFYVETIHNYVGSGHVVLSGNMTMLEACAVMVHELIHKLIYSPRYESLNDDNHRQYDKKEFQELVCRAVEARFLENGGAGLLPPRY